MYYYLKYPSFVGKLTVVSDENSIVGLYIEGQKYFFDKEMILNEEIPVLKSAVNWLDKYFDGKKPNISDISLNLCGSEFRKLVWNILCDIPYGSVVTYGEIAKKVARIKGKKYMSAQAIGGAISHNPISIIVPCHRVIGVNGNLTGYASGINVKKKLLEFEKVDMENLYMFQR